MPNNITTGAPTIPDLIYDVGLGRDADEDASKNIVVERLSQNFVIESYSKNFVEIMQINEINEAA